MILNNFISKFLNSQLFKLAYEQCKQRKKEFSLDSITGKMINIKAICFEYNLSFKDYFIKYLRGNYAI